MTILRALAALLLLVVPAAAQPVVNVYNWADYIDPAAV